MAIDDIQIDVFNFLDNSYQSVIIGTDNTDVIYAEDLVFQLTSKLNITTICAHLFALYHSDRDLWLCPNQELKLLKSELFLNNLKFQFRIRFIPSNLKTKLMVYLILNNGKN